MQKMINDREKAARHLAGYLRQHGAMIAEELQPRLERVLEEGEEMPDVAHLLDLLGRMVMTELGDLDQADRVRLRDGGEARYAQRRLHDEALPELRDRVVEVRRQMVQFCGRKSTSQFLHVSDRTPRAADDVEALAAYMVRNLPVMKVPEVGGQRVDPMNWVNFLAPSLDEVRDLSEKLYHQSADKTDSVKAKKEAMAGFDKTYRLTLKVGESLYRLTGFDRLAKHLRYRGGRPAEQKTASGSVA
ncbi:MAG: hypothetical protein GY719_14790 [bacterium]|nr:hypothetical protein [bacterium]